MFSVNGVLWVCYDTICRRSKDVADDTFLLTTICADLSRHKLSSLHKLSPTKGPLRHKLSPLWHEYGIHVSRQMHDPNASTYGVWCVYISGFLLARLFACFSFIIWVAWKYFVCLLVSLPASLPTGHMPVLLSTQIVFVFCPLIISLSCVETSVCLFSLMFIRQLFQPKCGVSIYQLGCLFNLFLFVLLFVLSGL